MEKALNISGLSLLGLVLLLSLLFLLKKSLYRKVDFVIDRYIARLFGYLAVALGIFVIAGGFVVVGFQIYAGLIQGQWIDLPIQRLADFGVEEMIADITVWLTENIDFQSAATYFLRETPLSIFLLLVGLFLASLGAALAGDRTSRDEKRQEAAEEVQSVSPQAGESRPEPTPSGPTPPQRPPQPAD